MFCSLELLKSIDLIGVVAKQTHKKFVYYTWYCGKNATMLLGYNNNYITSDNCLFIGIKLMVVIA